MSERDQLERVLRGGRPELRRFALERMLAKGLLPDVALLRELSEDADADVRGLAQDALGRMTQRELPPAAPAPSPPTPARTGRFRPAEVRAAALDVLRPCVDALLAIARDEQDRDLARRAVATLGRIKDWSTVDGLVGLLGREEVAAEAALALAAIGDLRAVRPIIDAIGASSALDRRAIVTALGGFRTRDTMLELVRFLAGGDEEIRGQAALTLRAFVQQREAREALLAVVREPVRRVAVNALLALQGQDGDDVLDEVLDLYRPEADAHVRATVMSALRGAKRRSDEVVACVAGALRDPDDRVRANAVETLRTLDVEPARRAELLGPLARDPDNRVLGNVAIGLGPSDPARALSILEGMLRAADKWGRASAVYVGRFIQSPTVAEWLVSVLSRDEDEDVLRNAVTSLLEHRDPKLVDRLLPLVGHARAAVRSGAVRVLATWPGPRVASALVRHFAVERDEAVLADIAAALGELGAAEYSGFLVDALDESSPPLLAAAIEALDRMGRLESVPSIVPFLRSPDPSLRAASAVALWHLGCLSVVQGLRAMLDHPESRFRVAAMDALATLGGELDQLGATPRSLHLCSALVNQAPEAPSSGPEAPGLAPSPASPSPDALAPKDEEVAVLVAPPPAPLAPESELDGLLGLLSGGRAAEAARLSDALHDRFPGDPAVQYLTGLCQLKVGATAEAARRWRAGAGSDPSFYPGAVDAAELVQADGDVVSSLRLYLDAFRRKLAFCERAVRLTERMLDAERVPDVSTAVRELLATLPLGKSSYHRLGVTMLHLREHDEARRLLRVAAVLEPESHHVRFNLALACFHLGLHDEARAILDRIIESVEPGAPEAERSRQLLAALPGAGPGSR